MKHTAQQPDFRKRKFLTLLAGLPLFTACSANSSKSSKLSTDPEEARLQKKFHGIYGVVLRLDATSRKHGITITNERGRYVSAPGGLGPKSVGNQTYTDISFPIPKAVRATWREGKFEQKPGGGGWNGGTIIGDYTVPVAERIPDSILDYIRSTRRDPFVAGQDANDGSDVMGRAIGRALRLKIRLADNAVLIGWDVEERIQTKYGIGLEYRMPGGDFQEAKIFNGAVVRKGWYIDKNGQKIETDY